MAIQTEIITVPTDSSEDRMLWAGIKVPLQRIQIAVMASFGLYWIYCKDPETEEEISKSEIIKAYILRICTEVPAVTDLSTVLPEYQQIILSAFGNVSSSEKTLKELVGFFKKITNYSQIKSAYSQVVNVLLNEEMETSPSNKADLGYFVTLRSGTIIYSLFPQEVQRLKDEELKELREKETNESINVFITDTYSRIKLVHILISISLIDRNKSVRPAHIVNLDDVDETEKLDNIELLFSDRLRTDIKEMAIGLLSHKAILPEISIYCARKLTEIFSRTTEKERKDAELLVTMSTDNPFLSNYYRKKIKDEFLIENGTFSHFSIKEELIVRVSHASGTIHMGIFFHEGRFYFSEDKFLEFIFTSEIRNTVSIIKNTKKLDQQKLKFILKKYFSETNESSDFDDIRAIISAIDNRSDADLVGALMVSARQRSYMRELLDLPLPSLERCRSILILILKDPKYSKIPIQPFKLQKMQKFSHQGFIDYLKEYSRNVPLLYLNIKGRITAVSVFDALKANASSIPVYASLNSNEIASYATPDEAYGLINQAACLIKNLQKDPITPNIDTLLVFLTAIKNPFGISEKDLNNFRSVTSQEFISLFTNRLNSLTDNNEKLIFRSNSLSVLAELQKTIRSSLLDKEKLDAHNLQLLANAAPNSLRGTAVPVGWFVYDKTGNVIYTLNSQKALYLAKIFYDSQEEEKYNKQVDIEGFPAGLMSGDIRLLTAVVLFSNGKINDAKKILNQNSDLPQFSPLALKQWSGFVFDKFKDINNIIDSDSLLTSLQKQFYAKKDISTIAKGVIESLSAVSSVWPKMISMIQASIQTTIPNLLILEGVNFYNEFDFWKYVWEKRITDAQSMNEVSLIVEEMLPEELVRPSGNYLESDLVYATNGYSDAEGLNNFAPFMKGNVPSSRQTLERIWNKKSSELDIGWVYERSKTFTPFFFLFTNLLRINGVYLSPEINRFLQEGLSSTANSNTPSVDLAAVGQNIFHMGIDPRRIPINRIDLIPQIYYNTNYCLSEEEIISTYLNNLLNPQERYPYDALFDKVDLFKLFSLGSIDAVFQILSQILCSLFADFPEKYPLAIRLGLNNTWEQIAGAVSSFVKATNDHPDLLVELFRSCFPQEAPGQAEKSWLFHSIAVMILMLLWAKNKKQSHEEQIVYAMAGLWHDIGLIDFGGAFDSKRKTLRGLDPLFNEYLTHQKIGMETFNIACEKWLFLNSQITKEAISKVMQYHHLKPRSAMENSIIQGLDDIVIVSYVADSVTHATANVMQIHAKGVSFEMALEGMLTKLSRNDSGKFHLPARIKEIFPNFCSIIRTTMSSRARIKAVGE